MLLSCIVLSSDSHVNKGNSIVHCLTSILNQADNSFEVILVENSTPSNKNKLLHLKSIKKEFIVRGINLVVVNNKNKLSIGKSRNVGVDHSRGDLIVFIDDDTIIKDRDAFLKIRNFAKKYDFGYGAKRYWTNPMGWFELNSLNILSCIKDSKNPFANHIGKPKINSRNNDYKLLQNSFIGNFGFCKRKLFFKTHGFGDFPHYGFEDDYLMFQLFKITNNFKILDEIEVIHVNHQVNSKVDNCIEYVEKLKKDGFFWFHVQKTFNAKQKFNKNEILEKLDVYHSDYRIDEAYKLYLKLLPPNINFEKRNIWKKCMQFDLIDYCQKIYILLSCFHIDEFVKKSRSDFDNLIPFLISCVKSSLCKIENDGKISNSFNFKRFDSSKDYISSSLIISNPNSKLNQFPCDLLSRDSRIELIKNRYPYADYLRIALIGDDDLLALNLSQESWINVCVIDKDEKIRKIINKFNPKIEFHLHDLSKKIENITPVQTFLIDPPYTFDGSLLFILRGLELLKNSPQIKEFYCILNETMMGSNMQKIQKVLLDNKIWVHEIIPNFNQYELPSNYPERKRANNFLKINNIDKNMLNYSSSSNLYIFRTVTPDIEGIFSAINIDNKYKHLR